MSLLEDYPTGDVPLAVMRGNGQAESRPTGPPPGSSGLDAEHVTMRPRVIFVTAWNNGKKHDSGAGYGVTVKARDRDLWFDREWGTVQIELPGQAQAAVVNIDKESFWNNRRKCRELISKEIGKWLIQEGLVGWPRGKPPKLELEMLGDRRFRLRRPTP